MKTLLFFIFTLSGLSLFAQKTLSTDTIRRNVTIDTAKIIVDTNGVNPDFIILDIRTPAEYANGHIANAININYYDANFSAELDSLDHNKMYLLHCQSGGRSTPTFALMQTKHFREVYHMNNGFGAWFSAGYPYVTGYTFAKNANASQNTEMYTNTLSNYLNVFSGSDQPEKLMIFNLQGQVVVEKTLKPGMQQFDLENLTSGVYIANIRSQDGIITRKISIL
jgi:rhodanese-related sulfurtransferase